MEYGTYILRERVLTDDVIHVIEQDGMMFKGGYVAIVEYHTFQSPWSDNEHVRRFRSLEAAGKWVRRHYSEDELDLAGAPI